MLKGNKYLNYELQDTYFSENVKSGALAYKLN